MRTILVIGLGRFGSALCTALEKEDVDVMAIDRNEARVNKIAPYVTAAQIGDCTEPLVIEDLDVRHFDVCFVCTSESLENSLVMTMLLKEQGARKVVTKVNQEVHAALLLRNGADDVIYPERDMAIRTAMRFSAAKAYDYVELNNNYGVFEVETPNDWIGKTIKQVGVRKNYQVNLIAYKFQNKIIGLDREEYTFNASDHLIIAGNRDNFKKLIEKNLD
ncbi:potassium channel family protein [Eubacteriales bacterium KG127]